MNERLRSSIKIGIAVIVAAAIVVAAVFLVMNYNSFFAQTGEKESVVEKQGVAYIETMEAVDTTPIEDRIFEEDNLKTVDELLAEFDQDPSAVWKTLKDYDTLIMGDSRAQCFLLYDFMDEQHCLVMHSTTIYTIAELLGDVAERKPHIIVISYGINDVGLYHDYGVENYMADFADLIAQLQEVDPGVRIYVNSIIPCLESEYDRAPNWMAIPSWNEYIKNYCAEHGIGYIDVTELADAHRDLYIDDGVHLVEDFYPYWGAQIAAQIASDMSIVRDDDEN